MRARVAAVLGAAALVAALAGACGRREGPPREFAVVFPAGLRDDGALTDSERRLWRVAARAAAEVAGPVADGASPVRVTFALPPRGGGDGVLGESRGGAIAVTASADPLKTAFRAGHECAHAVLALQFGAGVLPLWLEEGLAQLAGWRAADAFARTSGLQSRPVPPPEPWLDFDALVAADGYPGDPASVAAFYWQSALLVRALHARLGPAAFGELLSAAASGGDVSAHLREKCWFADGDFERLRRAVLPGAPPLPASAGGWAL